MKKFLAIILVILNCGFSEMAIGQDSFSVTIEVVDYILGTPLEQVAITDAKHSNGVYTNVKGTAVLSLNKLDDVRLKVLRIDYHPVNISFSRVENYSFIKIELVPVSRKIMKSKGSPRRKNE